MIPGALLEEAAARLSGGPLDGEALGRLAMWLPSVASGVDLTAARAEAARTGHCSLVGYRPGGPVLELGYVAAGQPADLPDGGGGVAVVLDGYVRYERFDRAGALAPVEVRSLPAGGAVWWSPAPGAVHRQTGLDGPAVQLVLSSCDHRPPPERAARCLERLAYHSLAQLYAPDVLLDADVPQWRFQVQGRSEVLALLAREELDLPDVRVRRFGWVATVDGGLVARREVRFGTPAEGEHRWRDVHTLRWLDGWIVEHTISCTGIWSPATIARQAAEAPMVVP